jgi:hypothetical protein
MSTNRNLGTEHKHGREGTLLLGQQEQQQRTRREGDEVNLVREKVNGYHFVGKTLSLVGLIFERIGSNAE